MSALHVVAGASGFLGSHLTDLLLARGESVLAVDNLATGLEANLAEARRNPRFSFLKADILEPLPEIPEAEYIWNLASPASPPDYSRLPIETLRVGSEGTRNLLDLASRTGARFLLASTSEVYGDPEVSPQREDYWGRVNPVGPRSMYDEAKRYAEALTVAYRRSKGVDTRIVRIFNTYGPRMRLDDGRVVPNFVGQALRNEPLTVYGDGRQTRSFCFVEDEVEGLRRAMASDDPGPINIGNPDEITILEFAKAVGKAVGTNVRIVHHPLPEDDPKQRRPDITRAERSLGWRPVVSLDEGLRRTIEAFRKAVH